MASLTIVGGGVCGLSMALSLAKAGMDCEVFEAHSTIERGGYGIQLSPNATRILQNWGVLEDLGEKAFFPKGLMVRSGDGSAERLIWMPLGERIQEKFGSPYICVKRADLVASLYRLAKDTGRVSFHFNHQLLSLKDRSRKTTLTFSNSEQVQISLQPGLVFGCDGVHSLVRAYLGGAPPQVHSGNVALRVLLPTELAPDKVSQPLTGLWMGPNFHLVHYRLGKGDVVNVVLIEPKRHFPGTLPKSVSGASVLSRYDNLPQTLVDLFSAIGRMHVFPLYEHQPGDWPKPSLNAHVFGDAAHGMVPHLSQGAASAIEDADAVGKLASGQGGDWIENLEKLRLDRSVRVSRIHRSARINGHIFSLRGPVALVRDLFLRSQKGEAMLERYAWIYGYKH